MHIYWDDAERSATRENMGDRCLCSQWLAGQGEVMSDAVLKTISNQNANRSLGGGNA